MTLNKFAPDCCMYMCPNYGFIKFPDSLTTGSSIMPHKKNPDVWEIIRGNCNRIMATEGQISMLCSNMPHGYHRDFQLLKDILFPSLELMHKCLFMAEYMLGSIIVNEHILESNPIYDYLFTVEEVNCRTLAGMPFRDAYKSGKHPIKDDYLGCWGVATFASNTKSHDDKGRGRPGDCLLRREQDQLQTAPV